MGTDDTQMADEVTGVTRNPAIAELRARIREHWDDFTPASRAVCRSLSEISPERLLYLSLHYRCAP